MTFRCFTLALLATPAAFAASEGSAAKAAWYADPVTFAAFLALIGFLLIVFAMGGVKTVLAKLDDRAANIQKQIDEAKALREEAARLMAEASRKEKEADAAAEAIIKRAKADADAMLAQAKDDLAAKVARREAQVESRIARAEAEALGEVRRIAADAATRAARDLLSAGKTVEDQFDKALKDIEGHLN